MTDRELDRASVVRWIARGADPEHGPVQIGAVTFPEFRALVSEAVERGELVLRRGRFEATHAGREFAREADAWEGALDALAGR